MPSPILKPTLGSLPIGSAGYPLQVNGVNQGVNQDHVSIAFLGSLNKEGLVQLADTIRALAEAV